MRGGGRGSTREEVWGVRREPLRLRPGNHGGCFWQWCAFPSPLKSWLSLLLGMMLVKRAYVVALAPPNHVCMP